MPVRKLPGLFGAAGDENPSGADGKARFFFRKIPEV